MFVIGALLITYFVSRLVWRAPFLPQGLAAILMVHAVSLGAICLLVFALRYPATVFVMAQLVKYVFAQAAWLAVDFYRRDSLLAGVRNRREG